MKHILFTLFLMSSCITTKSDQQTNLLNTLIQERLNLTNVQIRQQVYADFNKDGIKDAAGIMTYDKIKDNKKVLQESFVMILNLKKREGITYRLRSKPGRFQEPSFKLSLLKKRVKNISPDGDAVIFPNETGVDEYIFLEKGKLVHKIPTMVMQIPVP